MEETLLLIEIMIHLCIIWFDKKKKRKSFVSVGLTTKIEDQFLLIIPLKHIWWSGTDWCWLTLKKNWVIASAKCNSNGMEVQVRSSRAVYLVQFKTHISRN